MGPMAPPTLAEALLDLDAATRARVQPALTWFAEHGAAPPAVPSAALVGGYLGEVLPTARADGRESHEVAWSLGDLFEAAGLSELGALCRAAPVHARLAAWRWTTAFEAVPSVFWQPAMAGLDIGVPSRVRHSLASTTALLVEIGDGVEVTAAGHLQPATVRALDDRFRWTEEFPWMRSDAETDVAPLHFLHEHLRAQGLLARSDGRLVRTPSGVAATDDLDLLWRAVVAPEPRWRHAFELDALGVLAASLIRARSFTPGRVAEELVHVLAAKWHPTSGDVVFDRASVVVQTWYQLGVPLGWWDTGRGPADRRLNHFGHAAAAALFRSVTARRG